MQIRALILIIPFAIFFAETVSFIPAMKEACTIAAPKESSCCKKSVKSNTCSEKKESSKKKADKPCTDTPDCTSCPVCYTFLLQPRYEWQAAEFRFKKHYTQFNTSYLSSYTSNVWKPPNGFSLS